MYNIHTCFPIIANNVPIQNGEETISVIFSFSSFKNQVKNNLFLDQK